MNSKDLILVFMAILRERNRFGELIIVDRLKKELKGKVSVVVLKKCLSTLLIERAITEPKEGFIKLNE
jgi:hypothetical protein